MRHAIVPFTVLALLLTSACGDSDTRSGDPDDGGIVDGMPGLEDGAVTGDGGLWYCPDGLGGQALCQCNDGSDNDSDGAIDDADPACSGPSDNSEGSTLVVGSTECTDGVENDDPPDGLIDSQDPECTGPLDDDEGSFATGIPGDNMDECHQDCWFDGDSGAGNDGCDWRLGCDPVAGPAYDCTMPGQNVCDRAQTDECVNFCRAITPNGCDCFGCCDVYVDGVQHTILLHPDCSVDDIRAGNGDCVSCTQVESCVNTCEPCEFCIGHEPEEGCTSGLPDAAPCADGQTTCDPGDIDGGGCAADEFCLTGCCVSSID
jgi:hypothetical protein